MSDKYVMHRHGATLYRQSDDPSTPSEYTAGDSTLPDSYVPSLLRWIKDPPQDDLALLDWTKDDNVQSDPATLLANSEPYFDMLSWQSPCGLKDGGPIDHSEVVPPMAESRSEARHDWTAPKGADCGEPHEVWSAIEGPLRDWIAKKVPADRVDAALSDCALFLAESGDWAGCFAEFQSGEAGEFTKVFGKLAWRRRSARASDPGEDTEYLREYKNALSSEKIEPDDQWQACKDAWPLMPNRHEAPDMYPRPSVMGKGGTGFDDQQFAIGEDFWELVPETTSEADERFTEAYVGLAVKSLCSLADYEVDSVYGRIIETYVRLPHKATHEVRADFVGISARYFAKLLNEEICPRIEIGAIRHASLNPACN